ncbi:MAG: A/G-specific adenine glycosylase [Alkalispirochaeta sp.]
MQTELFSEASTGSFPAGLNGAARSDRERFSEGVREFYRRYRRPMPWRENTSPYWVFVSEVMLQQTQVPRVMEKFAPFVERFPDFRALAAASLGDVLNAWSGLGYNRRARFLRAAAAAVVDRYDGELPSDPDFLIKLPGIGANTAGSIAAFAFNRPVVFIETNIRRVFIHSFFSASTEPVHDRDLFPLIEVTLDRRNPREWYWALMDVGVVLSRSGANANRRSRHYTRQSSFEGSDRQLRGRILRCLTEGGEVCAEELPGYTGFDPERVEMVLSALEGEGFIRRRDGAGDNLIGTVYLAD